MENKLTLYISQLLELLGSTHFSNFKGEGDRGISFIDWWRKNKIDGNL